MRKRWLIGSVLALAALAIGGTVAALEGREPVRSQPLPRTAGYEICPDVDAELLRPYRHVDRKLPNLGGNLLGRSLEFMHRGRQVEVHVGYDVLDSLEDLDFEEIARLRLHGTEISVRRAAALPPGSAPIAAVWDDDRFEPAACQELTVVGRGLPAQELAAIVSKITIKP